jgi:hypothetical protein
MLLEKPTQTFWEAISKTSKIHNIHVVYKEYIFQCIEILLKIGTRLTKDLSFE